MKWSLIWLVLVSALSGCCETGTNRYDPFSIYGPKLVPPPATGTLGQPPGAYYQGPTGPPTGAPVSTGQRLLPVPSLDGQPRAASAGAPRTSGDWLPAEETQTAATAPAAQPSLVAQAGGALRSSDRLPWRIPASVGGSVQPAGAIEPVTGAYDLEPPGTFAPQGLSEITELPRSQLTPQGVPPAAVFPPVPNARTIEPVIYDQPVYDDAQYAPTLSDDYFGHALAAGHRQYSDQPLSPGHGQAGPGVVGASLGGGEVLTSGASQAWRQRR